MNDPEVLNACCFLLVMAADLPDLAASDLVATIRREVPAAENMAAAMLSPLSVPPVPGLYVPGGVALI